MLQIFALHHSRQFIAANCFQRRQIILRQFPQNIGCNLIIGMPEKVADIGNFSPRNHRVTVFHLVTQMPTVLRDDCDTALNQPTLFPVLLGCSK